MNQKWDLTIKYTLCRALHYIKGLRTTNSQSGKYTVLDVCALYARNRNNTMRSVCLASTGISDSKCSQWTAQGQICRTRIILRNYSADIFNLSNNGRENQRLLVDRAMNREKKKGEVNSSNKLYPMNYSHRSNLTVIPTFPASLQGLTIIQLCQFLDFDISRNKISECSQVCQSRSGGEFDPTSWFFSLANDFGMLSAIMNAEDAVKKVSQKKLTITEISWYFFSF